MTGLRGFIVAYHRLDVNDQVKKYRLTPSTRGFQVEQVRDNTLYLVCVVTRGSAYRRMLDSGAEPNPTVATGSHSRAIDPINGFADLNEDDFSSDEDDDVTASQLIHTYRYVVNLVAEI